MDLMNIVLIVFGFILVLAGRRLFWLFVGVVGFGAGYALALRFLGDQSSWIQLGVGLLFGLVGAWLAVAFQRVAVGIAGFLAGGSAAVGLLNMLNLAGMWPEWITFLLGGVLGVLLVGMIFEWALVLLSTLGGAMLVVRGFDVDGPTALLLLAILVIVGVVVQRGWRHKQ